jgi:hypothetical protein
LEPPAKPGRFNIAARDRLDRGYKEARTGVRQFELTRREVPAMIELSTIKTVVELFERALRLWNGHKETRAKSYDQIFEPLFSNLEPIVQSYVTILNDARKELQKRPCVDLDDVLEGIISKRIELVIARNSIVGVADSYRSYTEFDFRPGVKEPKNEEEAIKDFMYAIRRLFAGAEILERENYETRYTPVSSLSLRNQAQPGGDS